MSAQGTVQIDFGAFPGTDLATATIAGQGGIAAGSLVEAWAFPAATADHSADEQIIDPVRVFVDPASITPTVGFVITGLCPENGLLYGLYTIAWVWN